MTAAKMTAEINKLNNLQIRSLRRQLSGRGQVAAISVNERISAVTVEFVHANGKRFAHHLMLGPRGRIVYHEIARVA